VNHAVVGAFVLVMGGLLIAVLLWLASGGAFSKSYDLYRAVIDESVSGLNLNAAVKYNGVDVGRVSEIRLDRENPERVLLVFAIEEGTPIKVDTVAVLKTQGLTGIAYVELSGGSAGAAPLVAKPGEDHPVIQTKPSLSARLENVLTTVLAKLDSTSNNVNAILSEENRKAFSSALADIAAVSRTVAARRETIDTGIRDAGRTLGNASLASEKIEPLIGDITRSIEAIGKMGNEVANTSNTAGKTVNSVGADIKRFTSETLPQLERLLGELGRLSNSLRQLTEQTERDPRGLLFGRQLPPAGPGEGP